MSFSGNLIPGKKYGLILSNKGGTTATKPAGVNVPVVRKKPSVFNQSDSDSAGSDDGDWMKKSMKKTATNSSNLKKQTKIVMAQALEEDPTVFQYDEVYEKMESKKDEEVEKKKEVDRKPKYIKQLLKSAEIRNKENERRIERQVQKEREAEGEMFADKEKFVTSSYRAKMEEMAAEQEEEERKARIENALDVTKQKDMSGFYRHLYRQTHGEEKSELDDKIRKDDEDKIKKEVEDNIKKEKEDDSVEDIANKVKEQMKKIKVEDETEENQQINNPVQIKKINKKRALRKKTTEGDDDSESESSSGSSDDSANEDQLEIKQENLTQEEKVELRKKEMKEQKERREARKRKIEQDEESSEEEVEIVPGEKQKTKEKKSKKDKTDQDKDEDDVTMVGQEEETAPEEPKIDIWLKRTVGDVLESAVSRYWQRVADRRG